MTGRQPRLFDDGTDDLPLPPGLELRTDWVDAGKAERLLKKIDDAPWIADLQRRVQHYGYRYRYRGTGRACPEKLGDLPDWAAGLAKRLAAEGVFPEPPDQVIVNEYLPGQGIAAHIDHPRAFGDVVATLSLGDSWVMTFRRRGARDDQRDVLLPERSLAVMRSEARYGWTHEIAKRHKETIDGKRRRKRRVSVTFRTVLADPDRC